MRNNPVPTERHISTGAPAVRAAAGPRPLVTAGQRAG